MALLRADILTSIQYIILIILINMINQQALPNRPKLERVLATAKFVLDSSPPSSQRFELDTKIRLLELTLDALGLWAPKQRINKFDNTLIAKLPATKMEE
jgi:hypothetical protein